MKLGQRKGVSKEYQERIYNEIKDKSSITNEELQKLLPELNRKGINHYLRIAINHYRFNYKNVYNSKREHVCYQIIHY